MTTLIREEPYVAVVTTEHMELTCSHCFSWNLMGTDRVKLSRCLGCMKLYYCSRDCQRADWKDHKAECKMLKAAPKAPSQDVRMVARMLDKSKRCPEIEGYNGRTYESLVERVTEMKTSVRYMEKMLPVCREVIAFMGSKAPDMETVFKAYSKKALNAVGIHDGAPIADFRAAGIYLGLSVLGHSCRPDAWLVSNGSTLLLRCADQTKTYSDEITICYLREKFTRDTVKRRNLLFDNYFISCECEECLDEELDKKRTSGRSECCPQGWYSITHLKEGEKPKCSECGKEVSEEKIRELKTANHFLSKEIIEHDLRDITEDESQCIMEWLKLHFEFKDIASDHNVNLFGVADMILKTYLYLDVPMALRYVDICYPLIMQAPFSLNRCISLCTRYMLYDMSKKPIDQVRQACKEAFETVELIYGKDHELTATLVEKALEMKNADSVEELGRRLRQMYPPRN